MRIQRARIRPLTSTVIAAIFALLMFGLTTSYSKVPQPSPFLSPTGLTPRAWLPIVINNFPPIPTTSYYIKFFDYNTMSLLGCAQGQAAADYSDTVIVLDVGQPGYDGINFGAYGWDNPTYTFHSTTALISTVETYLISYYNCSPPHAKLTLAVGVNNEGPQVGTGHGVAWAQMINSINTWIYVNGANKFTARGGMDIEQSYPFQYPGPTRAWTDGYNSVFVSPSYYFDFGSCDGCPYTAPAQLAYLIKPGQ